MGAVSCPVGVPAPPLLAGILQMQEGEGGMIAQGHQCSVMSPEGRETHSAGWRAVQLVPEVHSSSQGSMRVSRCRDLVSKGREARACKFGDSILSLSLAGHEVH